MQQVKLISADEKLLIALTGEIDSATAEDFYAVVNAIYLHDKKDIVFDCSALTFIDSTTLGMSKPDKYMRYREKIKSLFRENRGVYGYRRLHQAPKQEGIILSEIVVRQIM